MISAGYTDFIMLRNLSAGLHLGQRATVKEVQCMCPKLRMELCLSTVTWFN